MEDLLFHATLISDITDHSKFMDTILFTKLSCLDVALLLLLLLLLLLFVLFLVFSVRLSDRQCQALVIRPDITIMVNWA